MNFDGVFGKSWLDTENWQNRDSDDEIFDRYDSDP